MRRKEEHPFEIPSSPKNRPRRRGETIIMFRAKKKRIRPKKEESALSFPVPWVDPVLLKEGGAFFKKKKIRKHNPGTTPAIYFTHARRNTQTQTDREREIKNG